jgi:hypothetical protein
MNSSRNVDAKNVLTIEDCKKKLTELQAFKVGEKQ